MRLRLGQGGHRRSGADRPLLRAGPSPQRRMLRQGGLPRRDDRGVLRRSRLGLLVPRWRAPEHPVRQHETGRGQDSGRRPEEAYPRLLGAGIPLPVRASTGSAGETLDPMRPVERFSGVGPESSTPRMAPARLRRPRRAPRPTRPPGPPPCQQAPLSDALTGPPSCSARLRRSACTFSGTSSSAPSPVSADTPSRVGVTSQLSTCRTVRVRKAPARSGRRPTPLQTARWNAVQKAKRRGLPIRRVAREVGILRDTAKKYMEAVSPPMKLDRGG